LYELADRASPVHLKQSHVRRKRGMGPPPMQIADKRGNVRTVYMVGEPMPVHDPLVFSTINRVRELGAE
jgi:hypothetical protein